MERFIKIIFGACFVGIILHCVEAGPPKERVHVRIHIPMFIHHSKHTKTIHLQERPNPKCVDLHQNYHFHTPKDINHLKEHKFGVLVFKNKLKTTKRIHKDIAVGKMGTKTLSNQVDVKNKKLEVLQRHNAPVHSPKRYQTGFIPIPPGVELINLGINYDDGSYSIGSGYQVEEHQDDDYTPQIYNAFPKNVDSSNNNSNNNINNNNNNREEELVDYLPPEKLEYITYSQRNRVKEDNTDFGSDVADHLDKFTKGAYHEGNAHSQSEFEKYQNHLENYAHVGYQNAGEDVGSRNQGFISNYGVENTYQDQVNVS